MFNYISKLNNSRKVKAENSKGENHKACAKALYLNLEKNISELMDILSMSNDVVIRKFNLFCKENLDAAVIYIEGLVNIDLINIHILKRLMDDKNLSSEEVCTVSNIDYISSNILSISNINKIYTVKELVDNLLCGNAIFLKNGSDEALSIDVKNLAKRAIEEPPTESVVRGPREGFTETLRTNTSLIRRKLKDEHLTFESFIIGERTKTDVAIAYLKDVVNPKLITEVRKRLNNIKTDSILESGYIEAFIEDSPCSIFSTVANSEKPDIVAAKILEGRVAIILDGTPFVLTVPMLFIESFQNPEDYYTRPYWASFIRILRFISYFITILLPASYVALSSFHQELIPTSLLLTMAGDRKGVAFPAIIEALLMTTVFEILREAGVRLPKPVGSAVSIVGALVLGEAAVTAGLISSLMVIIVAMTAISSFVVSSQTDSASILRYMLLILAGFIGGLGITLGLLIVLLHLCSLRSFGIPYLYPLAPFTASDIKDSFIRLPLWKMITRPKLLSKYNPKRQDVDNKPSKPEE